MEDKTNIIAEVDMLDANSVLDALMNILEKTQSKIILFNDKKMFVYTLSLFGLSEAEIKKAWKDAAMNFHPYGLVALDYRLSITNKYINNSILIFPDVPLIQAVKYRPECKTFNIIYDPHMIPYIASNKLDLTRTFK